MFTDLLRAARAGGRIPILALVLTGVALSPLSGALADAPPPLTLERALSRAAERHPSLASARALEDAALAERLVARARPAPELELEVENFGGAFRGAEAEGRTLTLSQEFELGGRRRLRREAAHWDAEIAAAELEGTARELEARVRGAFTTTLAAQRRVAVTRAREELAIKAAQAVEARVRAGKAPALEGCRARMDASASKLDRLAAEREEQAARQELAATWGGSSAEFGKLDGAFREERSALSRSEKRARLEQHPRLRAARARHAREALGVREARASRWPNLTGFAGIRELADESEATYLVGLSLPLPLFQQRAAKLRSAQGRRFAERSLVREVEIELAATLESLLDREHTLEDELTLVASALVDGARDHAESVLAGYEAGKLDFLAVLDAQAALADAELRQLDLLEERSLVLVGIESLSGDAPSFLSSAPARQETRR